jgi:hypothetical protein
MCGSRRLALRDLGGGRSLGGSLTPVGDLSTGILDGVVRRGEVQEKRG